MWAWRHGDKPGVASGSSTTTPARDRRDCTHPGTPHRHGTRVAYVTDGCHCTPCRAANRADERHRTAALRNGCWEPFVDAAPARGHLQLLRQHGVGLDQIVKISETPKTHHPPGAAGTAHIAPSNPVGNRPTECWPFEPSPEHLAPRSQVDATETHARIETLVEAGHSIPELARALGKSSVSLRRTLDRRTVTAQTALSVSNLYDRIHPSTLEPDFARRSERIAGTPPARLTG